MELRIDSAMGSMNEEIDIEKEGVRYHDRLQSEIPDRCASCY